MFNVLLTIAIQIMILHCASLPSMLNVSEHFVWSLCTVCWVSESVIMTEHGLRYAFYGSQHMVGWKVQKINLRHTYLWIFAKQFWILDIGKILTLRLWLVSLSNIKTKYIWLFFSQQTTAPLKGHPRMARCLAMTGLLAGIVYHFAVIAGILCSHYLFLPYGPAMQKESGYHLYTGQIVHVSN